jgi:hypothetical protein
MRPCTAWSKHIIFILSLLSQENQATLNWQFESEVGLKLLRFISVAVIHSKNSVSKMSARIAAINNPAKLRISLCNPKLAYRFYFIKDNPADFKVNTRVKTSKPH